ncbi:MAG: tRNA (N(6)-L-threonylcarbamoyladenosine(37)-C(2))-methylthiotransferase MtaB [Deltaproteobacteria bacterium]|nr:tRNA (N(6)-L-threonylcarbamoyladenosine(37)-C(2))-methylthiotransferase MtaB [Deltaproteobacteria bacterium]
MKTVAITTLGCKTNQLDSAVMEESLRHGEFRLTDFSDQADVYIINTCTVTHKSDFQSRQLIRRARRQNPDAKVIVAGCYAQVSPEEVAKIEGVDYVIGNTGKFDIARILGSDVGAGLVPAQTGHPQGMPLQDKIITTDVFKEIEVKGFKVSTFSGHTRAFLKIQEGCHAFCSYCIVPYARGGSRSVKLAEVMDGLKRLVDERYREVVLTGIHLGYYGEDLSPATDLLSLARAIDKEFPKLRVRISSLEPAEITDEFIEFLSTSSAVCNHLHIPLQSGDDNILKAMNRRYTSSFFASVIEKVVSKVADVGTGADVIVGFPGEGEGEFLNTYNLLKRLPVSYLHVFPYSKRKGTPAALFLNHLHPDTIKKRCELLRELSEEKKREFMGRFVGKEVSALVERGRDKETGLSKATTRNNLQLQVGCDTGMRNQEINVVVADSAGRAVFKSPPAPL